MRHPGKGSFDRNAVPKAIRPFCPSAALGSATEIDLAQLAAEGRKLVLLDVDNTLMQWKSEEVPQSSKDWVKQGRDLGLQFCILSNTRRHDRLDRIATSLGVEWIKGRFKPHPEAYLAALQKYGVSADEAIMVGDQLLTDVFGAGRAGIDSIWVQRISRTEFLGTKVISRNVERLMGLALRRWFQGAEDSERPGFFQRGVVRQLIKFGLVGGTATVVDVGLHWMLMYKATWGGASLSEQVGRWMIDHAPFAQALAGEKISGAAFAPLKVGPVLLAILVSYVLNWAWTFRTPEGRISVGQAGKFYLVALIGMVIQITTGTIVKLSLPESQMSFAIATLAGIVMGFAWNFNAQRLWTFKRK